MFINVKWYVYTVMFETNNDELIFFQTNFQDFLFYIFLCFLLKCVFFILMMFWMNLSNACLIALVHTWYEVGQCHDSRSRLPWIRRFWPCQQWVLWAHPRTSLPSGTHLVRSRLDVSNNSFEKSLLSVRLSVLIYLPMYFQGHLASN